MSDERPFRRNKLQTKSLFFSSWWSTQFLLLFCSLRPKGHICASAEAYNAYQYDMTLPQFTPDGRLMQLEYARLATDHSAPIFALPLVSEDDKDSPAGSVLAILTYRPALRLQQRLHVYENSKNRGNAVLLGMAGVLADCGALSRKVQESNIEHEKKFGAPFTTAHQWAMAASQQCQIYTLGGGIRPYGAGLIVVERSNAGSTNIFVTDPSGAIRSLSGNEITVPMALIGGGFMPENKLKRDLVNIWPDIVTQHDNPADRLARVFHLIQRLVLDALRDQGEEESTNDLSFEVTLVSSEKGIFKLTPSQIKAILARNIIKE
mmetsp:Transcript_12226/g.15985  ORF Transcript_12226/g.15985 Transcript_12226/m.15985 type:complete len:320 (-) Transcript_12226:34-993(-)